MNQPPNPPQYGVPPQGAYPMPQGPYPPYPPQRQGMSAGKIILIVGLVCFGAVAAIGVLVGILAVATIPKLVEAKAELELKQLEDIRTEFQNLAIGQGVSARLQGEPLRFTRGREFYAIGIETRLFKDDMLPRLISLNSSTDEPAAPGTTELAPHNCSYTAPRARELMQAMNRRGSSRGVLVTLNSRNWDNYGERGVPVLWSDAERPEWLTLEQAAADWGIAAEEWADPAGKLFGIKAPFQHTYE